jgi:hypothetical protein
VAVGVCASSNRAALRRGWQCRLTIVKLASVVFVAILESRQITGVSGERVIFEVRMFQGVISIDSFLPIELEQGIQQGNGSGAMRLEARCEIPAPRVRSEMLTARKGFPTGHCIIGGCATQVEDEIELVSVAFSCQYGLTNQHFTENASDCILVSLYKFVIKSLTRRPTSQLLWCTS